MSRTVPVILIYYRNELKRSYSGICFVLTLVTRAITIKSFLERNFDITSDKVNIISQHTT
jgi:hypothetical protein